MIDIRAISRHRTGDALMSAADNKKLMQTIFAAMAAGDRKLFGDSLAEDVTMTVTGQYSWSQTFRGKQSVVNDLHGYVSSLLTHRRTVPFRFIADDEWVAVEARGDMVTKAGERYDNHYCLIYRIVGGMIREIREYQDSALCERVLGPFPADRKQPAA
jgi:uncharacterized protein